MSPATELYFSYLPYRNIGFGLCNVGARIGGILSPLVLLLVSGRLRDGFLLILLSAYFLHVCQDHSMLGSSMFLMGVVGIVTAFFCRSLPETLNAPLPSILEDIQ